jgi:hypothetical protein
MMSVLSREPERSMLGLSQSVSNSQFVRALSLCGNVEYALLKGGSKGSNPARVALEGATENQLLGHVCNEWLLLLLTLT